MVPVKSHKAQLGAMHLFEAKRLQEGLRSENASALEERDSEGLEARWISDRGRCSNSDFNDPKARAPEGYDVPAALHDGVCAFQVPRRLRSRARSRVMSARRRAPDDVWGRKAEIRVLPGQ